MITVAKYTELSKVYDAMVDKAESELRAIVSGNTNAAGLVNDEIRKSDAYKDAKSAFDVAFSLSRNFASTVPNKIKREATMLKRNKK